jgi:hypothetical protein
VGSLSKGPGYTVNDLVYWSGMIAGIVGVVTIGRSYGVNQLVLLIGGIVLGAGLGFTLERAYRSLNQPPSQDQDFDRDQNFPKDGF